MATKTEKTDSIDLEALKAQIKEELRAEEAAKAAQKAEAKTEEEAIRDAWLEEYVTVQLFKDGKDYKDDVFVAVNGENCQIRRGVPVQIKRKFALVLESSQAQDIAAQQYAEERQREYDTAVRQFAL